MTEEFGGTIGRTYEDSTPWWPPLPTGAGRGAERRHRAARRRRLRAVRLLRLRHRHADLRPRWPAPGRRYANFHTTALCSPTRACLLTGRNHHSNGMARVVELAAGLPRLQRDDPEGERLPLRDPRPQRLRHLRGRASGTSRPATEMTMGSPRDKWPLGRGFERYYGFMGGETDQYHPDLVYDNHHVEPPRTPEEGYHLTEDLADQAILFLEGPAGHRARQAVLPVVHARARATRRTRRPPSTSSAYRGQFDQGWDAWRDEVFARQLASGPAAAAAPSCPSGRRGCRRGTR